MKKKIILLGLAFMALLEISYSFGQTTIDAEFRPRTEYRQGFRKPLADSLIPAFVTLQRSRFNADYKSKILNTRISMEDSRIWGNSDLKSNSSKVAVYEAWFEYLIYSGLSLQMGRQPLKYDDNRIFSSPVWGNAGIAHDALVLKYKSPFINVHTGYAYNNSKDTLLNVKYAYTPKQNYKALGYLWLSKSVFKGTTLSMIGVYEGFETKTNYNTVVPRLTYGGNLVFFDESTKWGGTLTAYGQQGKNPNKIYGSGFADLKSYFWAVKLSYKYKTNLVFNGGIDCYSGSKTTIDVGNSNTFNRLYGAPHNFNGYMEYFVALPAQGLLDYYGGISTKINPKLGVELAGHLFYFDKDFYYKEQKTDKYLGSEVDLVVNYWVSNEICIQGGYCTYFNSDTTKKYFNMDGVATHSPQWAYLMLTIRPQLYRTPPLTETKS
jgi:hypothetical protein